jgi:hypothetical protein
MMEFVDWLETYDTPEYAWCIKRLAGNDTLATKAHQAGPYIPKPFAFELFPTIDDKVTKNPRTVITARVDSHPQVKDITAIYYNSRFSEGKKNGRNETRLTGFGGKNSAVLDPDSTGAIAIFAFSLTTEGTADECHIWVCRHPTEEDLVEERFGPIEPEAFVYWTPKKPLDMSLFIAPVPANCFLAPADLPPKWLSKFPKGAEIVERAAALKPFSSLDVDSRLMKRRVCEYELFQSLEAAVEFPLIQKGFKTIDEFVARANTILQRRKARSGRSLELHARQIFIEEGLVEGKDFDYQPASESGKTPDFLFPSKTAYDDLSFPAANLRLLACKTTVKDRWRQVINEANRIEWKHLLTLQEGVSETQFAEMIEEKVRLVVPKALITTYPPDVRPHLVTLESFIGDVRLLSI